jgi:hypothetical protein
MAVEKHSSLLGFDNNYGSKKVYSTSLKITHLVTAVNYESKLFLR